MHVFQLESKTVFLHPPLYNFNAFSRQLQDTEMGSESSTANKNIWSCSRRDLKEHPRGQKRIENLLARCLSIFDHMDKAPPWQVVLQGGVYAPSEEEFVTK